MTNLVEKIEQDIIKSGFPLEMHVIEACSEKNINRMPNVKYEFEGRQREIDLHATLEEIVYESKKNPQYTTSNLLIECKKSESKPWVFFSSLTYRWSRSLGYLKHLSTFDLYFEKNSPGKSLALSLGGRVHNHMLKSDLAQCISYCEAFSKPPHNQSIYDAVQSVLDYTRHVMAEWRSREWDEYDGITDFYYPSIVVDGGLFEAQIIDGVPRVKEQDHIQLMVRTPEDLFVVDVVRKEYFGTYLDLIEKNHVEAVKGIGRLRLPSVLWQQIRKRFSEY